MREFSFDSITPLTLFLRKVDFYKVGSRVFMMKSWRMGRQSLDVKSWRRFKLIYLIMC